MFCVARYHADMNIGVLAVQGNFAEHRAILQKLGVSHTEVRTTGDLLEADHLIIPGGESTVISRFLQQSGLDQEIIQRYQAGTLPLLATCAGAILLAKEVTGKNAPPSLGLLDITIDRNAYGSQVQSFEVELDVTGAGPVHASFIRAPRITRVGDQVEVLATHKDAPVLVRQDGIVAATFHPELHGEVAIHKLWLGA